MAYYDALKAKWATLTPGTTQQKLDQLNALTVTGAIPTTMYAAGADVLNCVVWSEFAALTAAQQSNFLLLCSTPGLLLGGSANLTHILPGMIIAYFGGPSGTVTNLAALAKGFAQPWWQADVAAGGGGLSGPVSAPDLAAAGGLT